MPDPDSDSGYGRDVEFVHISRRDFDLHQYVLDELRVAKDVNVELAESLSRADPTFTPEQLSAVDSRCRKDLQARQEKRGTQIIDSPDDASMEELSQRNETKRLQTDLLNSRRRLAQKEEEVDRLTAWKENVEMEYQTLKMRAARPQRDPDRSEDSVIEEMEDEIVQLEAEKHVLLLRVSSSTADIMEWQAQAYEAEGRLHESEKEHEKELVDLNVRIAALERDGGKHRPVGDSDLERRLREESQGRVEAEMQLESIRQNVEKQLLDAARLQTDYDALRADYETLRETAGGDSVEQIDRLRDRVDEKERERQRMENEVIKLHKKIESRMVAFSKLQSEHEDFVARLDARSELDWDIVLLQQERDALQRAYDALSEDYAALGKSAGVSRSNKHASKVDIENAALRRQVALMRSDYAGRLISFEEQISSLTIKQMELEQHKHPRHGDSTEKGPPPASPTKAASTASLRSTSRREADQADALVLLRQRVEALQQENALLRQETALLEEPHDQSMAISEALAQTREARKQHESLMVSPIKARVDDVTGHEVDATGTPVVHKQLAILRRENDALVNENEALRTEVAAHARARDEDAATGGEATGGEDAVMGARLARLQIENVRLEGAIESLEKEKDDLESENVELRENDSYRRAAKAESETAALSRENGALKQENMLYSKENAMLRGRQPQDLSSANALRSARLEQENARLGLRSAGLERENGALSREMDRAISEGFAVDEAALAQARNSGDAGPFALGEGSQGVFPDALEELASSREQLAHLQAERAHLQGERAHLQQQQEQLEREKEHLSEERDQAAAERDRLASVASQLQEELSSLEHDNQHNKDLVDEQHNKDLEDALRGAEDEINVLRKEVNEAAKENDALADTLKALDSENRKLNEENWLARNGQGSGQANSEDVSTTRDLADRVRDLEAQNASLRVSGGHELEGSPSPAGGADLVRRMSQSTSLRSDLQDRLASLQRDLSVADRYQQNMVELDEIARDTNDLNEDDHVMYLDVQRHLNAMERKQRHLEQQNSDLTVNNADLLRRVDTSDLQQPADDADLNQAAQERQRLQARLNEVEREIRDVNKHNAMVFEQQGQDLDSLEEENDELRGQLDQVLKERGAIVQERDMLLAHQRQPGVASPGLGSRETRELDDLRAQLDSMRDERDAVVEEKHHLLRALNNNIDRVRDEGQDVQQEMEKLDQKQSKKKKRRRLGVRRKSGHRDEVWELETDEEYRALEEQAAATFELLRRSQEVFAQSSRIIVSLKAANEDLVQENANLRGALQTEFEARLSAEQRHNTGEHLLSSPTPFSTGGHRGMGARTPILDPGLVAQYRAVGGDEDRHRRHADDGHHRHHGHHHDSHGRRRRRSRSPVRFVALPPAAAMVGVPPPPAAPLGGAGAYAARPPPPQHYYAQPGPTGPAVPFEPPPRYRR